MGSKSLSHNVWYILRDSLMLRFSLFKVYFVHISSNSCVVLGIRHFCYTEGLICTFDWQFFFSYTQVLGSLRRILFWKLFVTCDLWKPMELWERFCHAMGFFMKTVTTVPWWMRTWVVVSVWTAAWGKGAGSLHGCWRSQHFLSKFQWMRDLLYSQILFSDETELISTVISSFTSSFVMGVPFFFAKVIFFYFFFLKSFVLNHTTTTPLNPWKDSFTVETSSISSRPLIHLRTATPITSTKSHPQLSFYSTVLQYLSQVLFVRSVIRFLQIHQCRTFFLFISSSYISHKTLHHDAKPHRTQ